MAKGKRLPILIASLVVAAALTYATIGSRSDGRSNILRTWGNIEVTDAELGFKTAGRVEGRPVSEGQKVEVGQVVAWLDSSELVQEAALRRAEVAAARAELAELLAGSRREEIAQAEAGLALAQAEAARLRLEQARQTELFEKEVIASRDYELAQTAREVAEARVKGAAEGLALLRNGPRVERIERARALLERAESALGLAQTRLCDAALRSPLAGIVLSQHVEPGEYVVPGTPVVTVGDLGSVWLRAYVAETDLGRVKVGQRVRVTADTYPGKGYEGRITFIASEAEFTPKSVQTSQERVKLVYRMKVTVPNPDMELLPGMPADAEIVLDGGGTP